MGLKHLFESTAPPAPNPALVDGPNWNDDHYFLTAGHAALGALGDLPYRGTGGLVTLLSGAAGVLQSAGSGSVPAYTLSPTLTSLTVTGTITADAIIITGAGGTISGPELGVLDGVTPGVVTASKAVVVDANKDISQFRKLSLVGLGVGIAAPASGITTVGPLLFSPDTTYDIGAAGATRPRNLYLGGLILAAGTIESTGQVLAGTFLGMAATGALYWGSGRVTVKAPASAQLALTNGAESAGVGLDVATDGLLKIRTRALSADASLSVLDLRVGVNPSTSGAIRLANNQSLSARNAANTGDVSLLTLTTGDVIALGASVAIGVNPATAGAIRLANAASINFRNAANTADRALLVNDALDVTRLSGLQTTVANDGVISIGSASASMGFVVVSNRSSGAPALFLLGGGNPTILTAGNAGLFSITAGTAGRVNVYWSAANSRYELENKMGSSQGIVVNYIGG